MIVRAEKDKNYTTIANFALEDPRLSLKAKGLWAFVMTKPDAWNITSKGLATQLKEGKEAVMSALRELEALGYLQRGVIRANSGKFSQSENILYEKPETGNPTTGNPTTIVNTELVNTETLSKDKVVPKKEVDPQATSQALLLASLIQERDPRSGRFAPEELKKWAAADARRWEGDIEKINRLDHYTWVEIESVIRWSQADRFWKDNIRSGAKLRQQFPRLVAMATTQTEEEDDVVIKTMKKQGLM